MQSHEQQGKIAKKRSRRSKKAHRSMALLKWTDGGPNLRKEASRRSRREARVLKVQEDHSATRHRLELMHEKPTMQCSFRQRLNFCVLDTSGMQVPNCPHGQSEVVEKLFGIWPITGLDKSLALELRHMDRQSLGSLLWQGEQHIIVNRLVASGVDLYYCGVCNDAVSLPHRDPVVGPLRRVAFRRPTRLINAVVDDNGEAQYWFTSESVNVIANALITNRCDGVLCIGAPTLFEHFRCSAQRRMSMKSFLLDFDCRFASFYQSSQFAQFSMLTNYFYDPASVPKFDAFLISVNHLAIVCDPPFGVIIRSLFTTIDELRRKFKNLHQG
uniref:Uncharacterized protein n=1 Tax=Ascaris lumbricoides TaxID=6252 RepID=A0A9J2PYW2_ASCLU